jgi:hypothetical protein
MLSPRKIPMLCIKALINPYILNYYISSVICVGLLEPFIAPFHHNCTPLSPIYIPMKPILRSILSYVILYCELDIL